MSHVARSGRSVLVLACLVYACAAPGAAAADESREPRNRVRFSAESAREVPNDWARAAVGISAEDVDPAALADRINQAMAWGLEQARADPRITARSGGYQTHPHYEDGRLRRWRGSQDLLLESGDSRALSALLGTLQSRLQLRSIQHEVSEATRGSVEAELVAEALAAFQARAELVRESLGAGGYAIDDISVDAGGDRPPPVMRAQHAEGMRAAQVAPPVFEAGSSRLTVTVHGTIVLE